MRQSVQRLYRRFYPSPHQTEDQRFDAMIAAQLRPKSRVLDAGAGAGDLYAVDYRDRCAEVVGVDLDSRVTSNPRLTRGVVASLDKLPLPDGYFDLVYSRYVFEHLDRPGAVLSEFHRVTKRGGQVIVLTPNRWHYVTLAASVTPMRFHRWYNRLRGRAEDDTFPTRYRINSERRMVRLFESHGFYATEVQHVEVAPNYLTLSPVTFMAGVAYERVVNRFDALKSFRVVLLGRFTRM